MRAAIIPRYLLGGREAIHEVARSRSAIWVGMLLVMFTAVARRYDQTHILENPVVWLFGPLLFSLVSGSWLYWVAYEIFARVHMPSGARPRAGAGSASFMGLFWMTAPIAWLYAIPVEAFMSSLGAAWANVALLASVSLWRVLLMGRVLQVICGVPFLMALLWVLVPAMLEALGVFFIGGSFAKAIMAGMGGLRNSPEEEVLISAMSTAFGVCFYGVLPVGSVALLWRGHRDAKALPVRTADAFPTLAIIISGLIWAAVALLPQRKLARNFHLERLIEDKEYRAALDYLGQYESDHFAPARPLAPKAFEHTLFERLPPLLAAVRADDPLWIQQHLLKRLDQMMASAVPAHFAQNDDADERISKLSTWLEAEDWRDISRGLNVMPAAQQWLNTNKHLARLMNPAAMPPPQDEDRISNREDL